MTELKVHNKKVSLPEQMAQELFNTLNITGCNPTNRVFSQNVIWLLWFSTQVAWGIAFSMYNVCCSQDIPDFIQHAMFVVIISQVLIKYSISRIFSKNLTSCLDVLFHIFWTDDTIIPEGVESYRKLNKYLRYVIIGYKKLFIYCVFIVTAETMYMTPFKPLTTIWTPETIDINNVQPYAFMIYVGEIGTIATCVIMSIVPLDSIYILLMGSAYIQFDCMIVTIKNIDYTDKDNAYKTLTKCVKHHNLILTYVKRVEDVYTLSLLSQLSAILFTICLAIYTSTIDTVLNLRPYMYALLSTAQLIVYCFGGQLLTDQGMLIADALYESRWYNQPDKSVRGAIIMMMQKSQKPIYISAGNVFILSIELFTKVLKASVSFLTMLKATTIKD